MPRSRNRRQRRGLRLAAALVLSALTLVASPAQAAEGSIDHVESTKQGLQVLYSLPAAEAAAPALDSLQVDLDGDPLEATATLASDAAGDAVRRTAILAVDVSASMQVGGKFVEAKRAAQTFLDSAPDNLYVGIVTFAGRVTVAQEPSLDRSASKAVVERLTLSRGTFLYDGLRQAVATSGTAGQRSVIVLSDGRDTSRTSLSTVVTDIREADVKVDVVALAQSPSEQALLEPLSTAGHGAVISAGNPKALAAVFQSEARTLANQILITAESPTDESAREGTLTISVTAGAQSYSDAAFVTLPPSRKPAAPATTPSTRLEPADGEPLLSANMMLGGIAAIGVGLLVVLLALLGGFGRPKESLESRIEAYTQKGRGKRTPATAPQPNQGVAASAVGLATKALKTNRGFEVKLGDRLDGAAVALKPAEWLLVHAGIALGAAAAVFTLGGGNVILGVVGLAVGAVLPWFWLGLKKSRRLKAFNSQLAPCLQLMAGSMQAGLSLAQSLDTVVREGQEPLAGEFRRALVETRLGVPIEDALDSIGGRMESADFTWTVMAIRIQREVGGNLAELLLNVAATLREREYLRRQVKSLSAEGRFSAYILLALPPGIILYMMVSNPTYLEPLISTPMGYVLLGAMVGLMALGSFTMNKLIKVEV
jgi:tight adherence protein B